MPRPGSPIESRRVLLVDAEAHRGFGHYPLVVGELSTALQEIGCSVEMLTREGWYFEGAPQFAPAPVHRFRRRTRSLWKLLDIAHRRATRLVGAAFLVRERTRMLVREAKHQARRLHIDDVVITSGCDPLVAARHVRSGRWLAYRYAGPGPDDGRVRPRGEVRLRAVCSVPENTTAWAALAPELTPLTLPFITARDRERIPDARRHLGIPDDIPVALLFGGHPKKDSEVVWQAFARLPDWQLVVAGMSGPLPAAEAYRRWAATHDAGGRPPTLVDGYVDEATRALLHSAADVVVVSFRAGTRSDSGNLADAVAWRCAVVVSDGCHAADVARRHELGTLFTPGDVDSLVSAVRRVEHPLDDAARASARTELGAEAVARRHLDALDAIGARVG